MARVIVPGEPVPADALEADRAAWVRALGISFPTIGIADALPGDVLEVPDDVAAELAARGWATDAPADLASLTVAELRALAAERGVELPDRAPKAELIAVLEHPAALAPTVTVTAPEEQ